jgi:uncharacterized protein (DUF1778 family)
MCPILAHIAAVPGSASNPVKAQRLVARLSVDDKRVIERAAALAGQSVAAFVVSHAREAARHELERHERILLDTRQSQKFVKALLAPPRKPSKAAERAYRNYRDSVKEA